VTWKCEEILAGLAEVEAGRTVANDKGAEWLLTWGTTNELRPPF
jgi:predicted transcriptional regulator